MDLVDRPANRPELCSHSARAVSFKCKKTTPKALRWPHPDSFSLTPEILASAGYFHDPVESEPDRTTCWMCGEATKDWVASDDPWLVHLEWAPNCPFARIAILDRQRDTQVPAWPDLIHQPWGPTASWFPRGQTMIEARLATFCGKAGQWRHEGLEGLPTRIDLARAGFHFAPNSFKKGRKLEIDDTTSCCYCRRTVSDWEAGDDPVSIHLKKGPCIFFTAIPPPETKAKPESSRKASNSTAKKTPATRKPASSVQDDAIPESTAAPLDLRSSRGVSKKGTSVTSASGKSSRPARKGIASSTVTSPTRDQSPAGARESSPPIPAPSRQKHPRAAHKTSVSASHILSSPDPIEISLKPPVSLSQTNKLSRSTSRPPSTAPNTRGPVNHTSAPASRTRTRATSNSSGINENQTSVVKIATNLVNVLPEVDEDQNTESSHTQPKNRKTKPKPVDDVQDLVSKPVSVPAKASKTRKAAPSKTQESIPSNPERQSKNPLSNSHAAGDHSNYESHHGPGPSSSVHIQLHQSTNGYDPKAPQLYTGILPVAPKPTRTPAPSAKIPKQNPTTIRSPLPLSPKRDTAPVPGAVDEAEATALLEEYFSSSQPASIPPGWLANLYNPSRPFPPLTEQEAAMGLEEYFAYRAEQEEAEFLAWVEEKRMRPWLKRVEEGRQMIEELIRTSEEGKIYGNKKKDKNVNVNKKKLNGIKSKGVES
ncbi:uncharacterized protein MELLADRAFT_116884 [Melampsora larici-populina 98AG31]|uniref:Inhibitor of apoptosis repeat-containing protein n=1 Tax=Melampsora larici-populina (strain 98AG31 / pathotype 3-4-7) TaxID=747676 RepID=F4RQZ7_MELLP|nr:uncharacterized protein MELLADRAFT_116884 [Melampsora larici-populina 98AG31]EGG05124.1 hypothetical protein MELLADRAFT_116884 [Melampsora larici-populina 98AG31]